MINEPKLDIMFIKKEDMVEPKGKMKQSNGALYNSERKIGNIVGGFINILIGISIVRDLTISIGGIKKDGKDIL